MVTTHPTKGSSTARPGTKSAKQQQAELERLVRAVVVEELAKQTAKTSPISPDPGAHEFLKAWREEPEPSEALIKTVGTRVRL